MQGSLTLCGMMASAGSGLTRILVYLGLEAMARPGEPAAQWT